MTQTVGESVFDILQAFGIDRMFGNPGSTELPMFRYFPEGFQYILGLQESIVVAMADGFAQASRRPAVVNLHSAAGLGHGMGNVFTAFKNKSPLLITAGQQARSLLPFQPYLYADQASEFPKPYVKWSCEPARAADVPGAIARAIYISLQPPRGPVFVSIPVDDWDRACEPIEMRSVSSAIRPDPAAIVGARVALENAKSPCFIVGAEVALDDAWAEAIVLAERCNAPVWVSPMAARNSFPEDHSLFQGFLPANRGGIVERLAGYDVILALGAPVFTYHVEGIGAHIPPGSMLYQITDDPQAAAHAATGSAICSSVKLAIADLLADLPTASRSAPPLRPMKSFEDERLTDAYLCQRISVLRQPDSIIVEEAPSSRTAMQLNLPMLTKDSFYTCASGGLGHGLPAAIGVALARRDKKVICLLGDGSSLYAIQGLWTAVQLGLPISFVIIKNGKYEALEQFGRYFNVQKIEGTKLPNVDFVGLAEAQGVSGRAITSIEQLDDDLLCSFMAPEPTLLEVSVE